MFLTISDQILHALVQPEGERTGALYGRRRDQGDVLQVKGLDPTAGEPLGQWLVSNDPTLSQIPLPSNITLGEGDVLLLVTDHPLAMQAYSFCAQQLHPIESSVIRLHADYAARIQGLFEVDTLAEKRVAIIGLGTGGSLVATQLVRCGIGKMRLVDFDRLEVHNIARHTCGLSDIGRYKTQALRDMLLNISPLIQVETYEADILAQPDVLHTVIEGCDLVVAATDSEQSKVAINRVCWPRGIPAVYAAAYNRAFGGDVFRACPPDGACYDCFQLVVTEFFGPPPTAATDFSPGYADPSRMADLIAEPGLGMDTGMIALLLARMALMTLLCTTNTPTTLPDFPTNWVLFGNRAEWVFEKPLESIFVDVPKNPYCSTCNYDAYVQHSLGMTAQEAEAAAQSILSTLPQKNLPFKDTY